MVEIENDENKEKNNVHSTPEEFYKNLSSNNSNAMTLDTEENAELAQKPLEYMNECMEQEMENKISENVPFNLCTCQIIEDNLEQVKVILENYANQIIAYINSKSLENLTPIKYAVLNGSLNTFIYLLSVESLKGEIQTDVIFDGFHLIHLSIVKSIFSYKERNCLENIQINI